jgi:Glycosyl hydrolase catalytic core
MTHGSAHADTASTRCRTTRRGRRAALLLSLLALAVVAFPASGADAKVPKSFFGITEGGSADAKDYQQMHAIKVRTFRLSIFWRITEPAPGAFNWSRTDAKVAALARNRITPAPLIWGSPQWATGSGNPGVPPLKGNALRAWKSFLKAAVKRYKKGGEFWRDHPDLPKKPVKTWQIWNEPNLAKYFGNKRNPKKPVPHTAKAYGKFVKASDKAIHKADKHSQVILAGLSNNAKKKKLAPDRFIKTLLKIKGIEKHFKAAALHPYAPSTKKYSQRISEFRRALKKGGAKKKKIWLTEVGWGSKNNRQGLNKGLSGQAKILKKSFKLTLNHRKKWKIDRLYWFEWRDPPRGAPKGCSFCSSAGLLRANRSKKPSYRKFKHFTKMQGRGGRHRHQHAR